MKDDGMISRLPTYKQTVEKRSPILRMRLGIWSLASLRTADRSVRMRNEGWLSGAFFAREGEGRVGEALGWFSNLLSGSGLWHR